MPEEKIGYQEKIKAEDERMDLKKNICDSVKECEIKLGYREEAINLYYPESVLLELLPATKENLAEKILKFCSTVQKELGEICIAETKEKGRYCVTVPEKGVAYVHSNVDATPFLLAFIQEIHKPGQGIKDIVEIFRRFSKKVVTEELEKKEWAVYFEDTSVDEYVYYLEEDDFGIQYHRFTRASFEVLKQR